MVQGGFWPWPSSMSDRRRPGHFSFATRGQKNGLEAAKARPSRTLFALRGAARRDRRTRDSCGLPEGGLERRQLMPIPVPSQGDQSRVIRLSFHSRVSEFEHRLDHEPVLRVVRGAVDLVEVVVGHDALDREAALLPQRDQPGQEDVGHALPLDDAF